MQMMKQLIAKVCEVLPLKPSMSNWPSDRDADDEAAYCQSLRPATTPSPLWAPEGQIVMQYGWSTQAASTVSA